MGTLEPLWRGTVSEARGANSVWVDTIGLGPVGPMPSFVTGVQVGDTVIVGAIRGSRDNLAVIASAEPARLVAPGGAVFRLVVDDAGEVSAVAV